MPYAAAPELDGRQARILTNGFFVVTSIAWILWPLLGNASFNGVMRHGIWFMLLMGFGKFFSLGMLGELIKKRWKVDQLLLRAFIWGLFGVWITFALTGINILVDGMIAKGFWWAWFPAFSKSLWINGITCYAWGMMAAHDYTNHAIREGTLSLEEYSWHVETGFLFRFVPLTILYFWLPAHTLTYALPIEYRPLLAAVLAIALGIFQTVGKRS